jgi:hypothetical protein
MLRFQFEIMFQKDTRKKVCVAKNILITHHSAYNKKENNVLLRFFSQILPLIYVSVVKPPRIADGIATTRLSISSFAA